MERPSKHLYAIKQKYPVVWKYYDFFHTQRGKKLPDWPKWCYSPSFLAHLAVTDFLKKEPLNAFDAAIMAALAAWRPTQGVYRFDQTVAEHLISTTNDSDLPSNILFALPEWCLYIETPPSCFMLEERIHGFFVHLDFNPKNNSNHLKLLIDTDNQLLPLSFEIKESTNILQQVNAMIASYCSKNAPLWLSYCTPVDFALKLTQAISPCISLLLYLCSENSDISGDKTRFTSRIKPTLIKTNKGLRMFAAPGVTIWHVADSLGNKIREYHTVGNGSSHESPRPHIRKAHWHTFLTGPKNNMQRSIILHWIPPLPINISKACSLTNSIPFNRATMN